VIESNAFANPETGNIEVSSQFVVGLTERGQELLKVFPNPAQEKLFIELENLKAVSFEFRITDVQGRTWLRAGPSDVSFGRRHIELDLRNLPQGIYLMTLFEKDEEIKVGKLIIQR